MQGALAAGLRGGGLRYSYSKAGKVDQFGVNFQVRIIVENDIIRPFKKISGKVVLEARSPIKYKELIIQFEGLCTLRYATKFESRTTFHHGRECISMDTKPECQGYQESPVRHVILEDLSSSPDSGTGFHTLTEAGRFPFTTPPESGFYTVTYAPNFSFTLEIPGNPHLPAPFKTQFGSLVYRLAVYMKSTNNYYVEVGEKVMRFNGHHNLLDNIEAMMPISIENSYRKSLFTRKKLVEAVFSVECSGFLPGERIPFILDVKNPKCIPLELLVQLVQHVKFDANGKRDSPKRLRSIVGQKEKEKCEPEPDLTWVDSLIVRTGQAQSFSNHRMYNIEYTLQFKVIILNQGTIRGEIPIVIGTTRDPAQILMMNANCLDDPFPGLRRRGSVSSTRSVRSHSSLSTTVSLPPPYSQLSSRIPSAETLPPAYDEVEQLENEEEDEEDTQVPSIPSSPPPEDYLAGTSLFEENEITELGGN